MMTVPVKISAWNINGYKSRIVGNKLNDSSFLEEIKNDNIVTLVETHNTNIDDNLSIPGFRRVKVKNRDLTNKSNKGSGGLACFAKEGIFGSIVPINNDNKNTIWIKIKKDILDKKQDVYVGTVYLTPHKNNDESSKKNLDLFEEIIYFQNKGAVIVQGDFNARTGVGSDFVTPDKYDTVCIENLVPNLQNRNSEDKVPADHRGKELLELCKSLGLVTLNGRKVGDLFGACTSFQWNGSSVVDYVLVSQSIYSSIRYFKIGKYIPWLADHCATRFELDSCLESDSTTRGEGKKGENFDTLFWNEDSHDKFIEIMKNREQDIGEMLDLPETRNVLGDFQDLMKKVIDEGNFKKKRKKPSGDAPWFDEECRKGKEEVNGAGKSVQTSPRNIKLRTALGEKKRRFKKLIRTKKRSHTKKIFEDILRFDRQREIKKFWKSLKSLGNDREMDYINCISENSWTSYFERVKGTENGPVYPPDDTSEGPLDYEITLEELTDAKGVLKNGKASAIDLISYEMLKCVIEYDAKILLKVFNYALRNNAALDDWFVSIIAPIHKKGSKMDPDNYRGVSLISCLYKLLTAILNRRLGKFCKENNVLSVAQLGFVPENRTSDAHFILHNLIKDYCHGRGRRLYACFVDFSKAFDCIPRDTLFNRLKAKGITGRFFNLIKNIYMHEKCRIKIGGVLSGEFDSTRGVRQGCILSPILFNIFISDLPDILNQNENEPAMIGYNTKIGSILWADDLVMLSESEAGLTKMLRSLALFGSENGLKINADKTKCMVFNKTGRHIRCNIKCGDLSITSVREYKYLGFLVTPSGGVEAGILDLKSRALYALVQLRKKLGDNFRKNIGISFYLFDTLVKPIIMYCSDFWGVLKINKGSPSELLPKKNIIDLIHMKFLKQLLGVQLQTSNTGVLLETGRVPLMAFALKNCIKNWNRIAVQKKCSILTLRSYSNIKERELEWYRNLGLLMDNLGLRVVLNGSKPNPEKIVFQRMIDIFHQKAFAEISNEANKLRTYSLVKGGVGEEPYLRGVVNINDRISMTRFRLSNHKLMIEKGRHRKIDKSLRKCPFCMSIEDEMHFLVDCKTFLPLRSGLLVKVEDITENIDVRRMEKKVLFTYLLTNSSIAPLVARYLTRAMGLRDFLIESPKGHV